MHFNTHHTPLLASPPYLQHHDPGAEVQCQPGREACTLNPNAQLFFECQKLFVECQKGPAFCSALWQEGRQGEGG